MSCRAAVLFAVIAPLCAQTPAEIRIAESQRDIARQPGQAAFYNSLASAYARRAEETSDPAYYVRVEEPLQRSLQLEPDNFEARKIQVQLLLGHHEFGSALEAAGALHKRVPDDVTIHGYLADADMELGNYADAVQEVQWMLNLRPGNAGGLSRAAALRQLHGDLSGALEWTHKAYDSMPPEESADRASLLSRIARLQLLSGNTTQAEIYANSALRLFPDYHDALGTMAEVRLAQGRNDEAIALLEKLYAAAPSAKNLYALAKALDRAGRSDAAARAFAEFEQKALEESNLADNANHELVAYYVDRARQPAKALQIASAELTRRHDVFTLDAYAWSLAACGDFAHAGAEMKKAVAFGIRDPEVLRHASEIAAHQPKALLAADERR